MLAAGSASAETTSVSVEQLDELRAQIKALQQEVRALKGEVNRVKKAKAAETDRVTAASHPLPSTRTMELAALAVAKMSPSNRPSICTSDNLNCIALTSRLHFDVGGYDYRPDSRFTTRRTSTAA
jgi:phosphate-selective porin OprO and OprP